MTVLDEARAILASPLCHMDEPTLRRIIETLLPDAERIEYMERHLCRAGEICNDIAATGAQASMRCGTPSSPSGAPWSSNPWVWAVTFSMIEP